MNASHVIVFATRETVTDAYLVELFEKEELDGKFTGNDHKQQWKSVVRGWIDMHRYDVKDLQHWMEKQTYLALGMMLMAAPEMGVDAALREGFSSRISRCSAWPSGTRLDRHCPSRAWLSQRIRLLHRFAEIAPSDRTAFHIPLGR
jgi:hypothetical protein